MVVDPVKIQKEELKNGEEFVRNIQFADSVLCVSVENELSENIEVARKELRKRSGVVKFDEDNENQGPIPTSNDYKFSEDTLQKVMKHLEWRKIDTMKTKEQYDGAYVENLSRKEVAKDMVQLLVSKPDTKTCANAKAASNSSRKCLEGLKGDLLASIADIKQEIDHMHEIDGERKKSGHATVGEYIDGKQTEFLEDINDLTESIKVSSEDIWNISEKVAELKVNCSQVREAINKADEFQDPEKADALVSLVEINVELQAKLESFVNERDATTKQMEEVATLIEIEIQAKKEDEQNRKNARLDKSLKEKLQTQLGWKRYWSEKIVPSYLSNIRTRDRSLSKCQGTTTSLREAHERDITALSRLQEELQSVNEQNRQLAQVVSRTSQMALNHVWYFKT